MILVPFLLPFVAGFLLQQGGSTSAPDAVLLDELVRRTNELPGFAAEYTATPADGGPAKHVRILYQAPDRTRLDLGEDAVFRIRDGFLDVRVHLPGEKPMAAHVAMAAPIEARFERLAAAMRTAFPASAEAWSSSGAAGIRFDLSTGSSGPASERSLRFTATYTRPARSLLGWLEVLRARPVAAVEDGRIVFEEREGIRITLSTKTGFIERVEGSGPTGRSTFELTSLDTSPELAPSAFDLPPAPADAVEASTFFEERVQETQTTNHRRQVFATVAGLVARGEIAWDAGAEERLASVLEVLHEDGWRLGNAVWAAEMHRRMEEFVAWYTERVRDPELAAPKARAQLDRAVEQWKAGLPLAAATALEPRRAELSIDAEVVPDDALREAFLAVEREALEPALQHALVDPLLRDLDGAVERARLGD